MAEIVEPLFDVGSIVGVAPADGIVSALADDGSIVVLEAWDSVHGDAIHTAPAGSAIGGGTRRHLFDRELYVDSGGGAYVNVRAFASLTGVPTTVQGYGITNAVRNDTSGTITNSVAGTAVLTITGLYAASGAVNLAVWQRSGAAVAARIRYDDSATNMRFGTSTAHDMVLERGGTAVATIGSAAVTFAANIAVGTDAAYDLGATSFRVRHGYFSGTVTTSAVAATTVTTTGAVTIGNATASTNATLTLNGATTSGFGPYIAFQRGGVAKAYVGTDSPINGTNSDNLELFSTNSVQLTPGTTAARVIVNSSGMITNTDNAIDFGGASNRWRDGYFSRNVTTGGLITSTGAIVQSNLGTTPSASSASVYTLRVTNLGTGSGVMRVLFYDSQLSDITASIDSVRTGPTAGSLTLRTGNGTVLTDAITITSAQAVTVAGKTGFGAAPDASYQVLIQSAAALKIMTSVGGENGLLVANAALNVWRFTVSTLQLFGTLSVNGDLLPTNDNANDLGTASFRFRDMTLSRNAVIGGTLSTGGILTINPASGSSHVSIKFNGTERWRIGDSVVAADGHYLIYDVVNGQQIMNVTPGGSPDVTFTNVSTVRFPGIGTTASAANVFLDNGASNSLLRSTSSLRYKANVAEYDLDRARAVVMGIDAILFESTAEADNPDRRFVGFAAEQVWGDGTWEGKRFVHLNGDGDPDGVAYASLVVPHNVMLRNHDQRIEQLEAFKAAALARFPELAAAA